MTAVQAAPGAAAAAVVVVVLAPACQLLATAWMVGLVAFWLAGLANIVCHLGKLLTWLASLCNCAAN